MTERPKWFRNPLWWVLIVFSPFGLAMIGLAVWAIVDRQPPLRYLSAHSASFDPGTRLLEMRWNVERNRYCPGEMVRTIVPENGNPLILPRLEIDPAIDPPDVQAARIGTRYVGRENLIDIPRSVFGPVRVTTALRLWCNPFQVFLPIVSNAPSIYLIVPRAGTGQSSGDIPVTVGEPAE